MDKFILCCFLWIFPVFGSNVDILVPDSLANEHTNECGRNLTLPCKFKNKTFAIAWMNLNDISPIAQCVRNKCKINPKYIDQYKISYDETNHIFNLTIIKLTMKDNGRKLVCSDGTNTDSQLITVKDYEPLILENTTTGTIQAISGCVTNVTKVSFKWIKIYAHNKREKEITPKIQNASITSCSKDSDCGNDQQIQYSEVISAKASNNGNYFLKIVADYGNKQKESYYTAGRYLIEDRRSVGRYLIEDRDEEQINIVIVVVFALILAAAVLLYLHRKKREESVTQTVSGYDRTEDLAISAPDINRDLPKRNVEEVSSEANDMPVKEPSVNNLSLDQAVPGIEEEKILSFEEQTTIDLVPGGGELGNDEKQKYLLAKHHGLDGDMLENEEEEKLLSKEQTIIDPNEDSDESEEYHNTFWNMILSTFISPKTIDG